MDGNFGDYRTEVSWNGAIFSSCNCPYPEEGCKHVVAVLFDLLERSGRQIPHVPAPETGNDFLSHEEIRQQALEDRQKRAEKEMFKVIQGDMFKGDHLIETPERAPVSGDPA